MSKQLFDHQLKGNFYVTIHNRSHIQEAEKIKSKTYMTRGSITISDLATLFQKYMLKFGSIYVLICLNYADYILGKPDLNESKNIFDTDSNWSSYHTDY